MEVGIKGLKPAIVLIIISMLTLLAGCSGRSAWPIFGGKGTQVAQDSTPFTTNVHTGIYGVTMQFATDNPPSTVYYTGQGTPFNIILELRNRGATDITEGYLYLSGYDRNIIQPTIISPRGKNLPMFFTLEGVTNFNPEGEYNTIEFENSILNWPPGKDQLDVKFRADACYKYRTVATPVVCIDPFPYSSLSERKVCRVVNVPMAGGQGGPIQVDLVEEEATEQYVYFRIHISNTQSKGVVFDYQKVNPGYPDSCPFNIQYTDINKVYYTPPTFVGDNGFNPQLVECTPDSPVRLVSNKATIYCKYLIPSTLKETYQTPLSIVLDYGYNDYEEKTVSIKNVVR
jgi:hypothetical protein